MRKAEKAPTKGGVLMSDQNATGKSKYETPILVSLGGVAKGAGANCVPGATATGYCSAGNGATGSGAYCSAGTGANGGYCTAGVTAADYCTSSGTVATLGACTTSGFGAGAGCSAGTGG